MRFLVLLDQADATQKRRVAESFAAAGADAEVRMLERSSLDQHVCEVAESDIDALIAGGDGATLNAVANALAKVSRKPLGVLPMGSNSYVARDLDLSESLVEAITQLSRGKISELPVGEINGRIFLNLSTIGLHSVARDLHLGTRGRTVVRHASALVVCNNPHQLRAIGIEPAASRERGLLNCYVCVPPQPKTFVGRITRKLFRGDERVAMRFTPMPLPELRVEGARRTSRLTVVIDGEVLRVRGPLTYRIRATPLRVLVPATNR